VRCLATATYNAAYTGSAAASGGTLTISGTPGASPADVTFNVKVTDTTTGATFTRRTVA
jgi:hypothetical protein